MSPRLYSVLLIIYGRLTGLVKIIPGWVPASIITAMRGLLIIPIYILYQRSFISWAIVLFFAAWFTDVIDGLHARYRKQESTFGKLFDPAVDKIFVIGLLILIAPGRISPYVVYVIISLEVVLVIMAVVLRPISLMFHIKMKLGANIFGKMKMFFEGLTLSVLLVLNNATANLAAECILWCAALFAVLSIAVHVTSREDAKVLN